MKLLILITVLLLPLTTVGCSKVHPDHRSAVAAIESIGGKVILNEDKKVIDVQLGSRPVQDEDLKNLSDLDTLEVLHLGGTDITSEGLISIENLTNLRKLNIGGGYQKASKIDDAGLTHLKNLSKLEELVLSDTQISDAGLAHLTGLKSLGSLYIFQTKISDEGLKHLEELTSLHTLRAMRTRITEEGGATFQAKMPNLKNFIEKQTP